MTEQAKSPGIDDAKALMARGHFAEARQIAKALSDQSDESLYVTAVCERYLGNLDQALETLNALTDLKPAHPRAYQELGHVAVAQRDRSAAISAYRQAVSLNPALLASWQGLSQCNADTPQPAEIHGNIRYLESLPRELLSACSMMHEGKLYRAEQLCRHYLRQHPKNVEGMRILAALGIRNGILDDAEFLLESATVFEPDHRLARLDYLNVLYRRQKFERSLAEAQRLLEADPDNQAVRLAFANQNVAVGDFDTAIAIYDDITRDEQCDHTVHLTYAHALKTIGRVDDAIESYRNAYRTKADFGDAYWSLANLKTYRFRNDEITAMQRMEGASSTTVEDRIHLCFALGKCFEDGEQFPQSFEYYERGNTLRRETLDYSTKKTTARFALQKEVCTPGLFARNAGSGCQASDPIFIVGLPRAGSTLLEQIISSHSMVDGTMELQNITGIAQKLDGRRRIDDPARYPAVLAELSQDEFISLGKQFIDETRIHRADAPYFIDKLPNNFVHIGLIHLILPNAKVIDARRDAMACCFAGFKQLFASGQEYTYGLNEIGSYYRDYMDLMNHWDKVLPRQVLRVQYEDVVADLDSQVRRILTYLELPFEDNCLRYWETERSIRTPSSEQVRQPVYTSAVEQWRNYEPWLDPLKESLAH